MRYQSFGCARILLLRGEENDREVLLQLRQNTGYMDNMYDTSASGHLEPGETLAECVIRETAEEIGVKLQVEDLRFCMVNHSVEENYIRAVFSAELPEGAEPRICEPEKCGGLKWCRLDSLPDNIIPYIPKMVECIERGIYYDDGDFTVLEREKKAKKC